MGFPYKAIGIPIKRWAFLMYIVRHKFNAQMTSRHLGDGDPSSNSTLRFVLDDDNSQKEHFVVALPETITPPICHILEWFFLQSHPFASNYIPIS